MLNATTYPFRQCSLLHHPLPDIKMFKDKILNRLWLFTSNWWNKTYLHKSAEWTSNKQFCFPKSRHFRISSHVAIYAPTTTPYSPKNSSHHLEFSESAEDFKNVINLEKEVRLFKVDLKLWFIEFNLSFIRFWIKMMILYSRPKIRISVVIFIQEKLETKNIGALIELIIIETSGILFKNFYFIFNNVLVNIIKLMELSLKRCD